MVAICYQYTSIVNIDKFYRNWQSIAYSLLPVIALMILGDTYLSDIYSMLIVRALFCSQIMRHR